MILLFRIFLLVISLAFLNSSSYAQHVGIIPQPEKVDVGSDSLSISNEVIVHVPD